MRLMLTTSFLLYSARIMQWTCHFIYMFVSVLCSISKYKLLLCFVFVLLSKIFYLTLCELNLYFLCLFLSFVSVQSFYMPPWPIFEKFSIQFQGPEFFNSLSCEIQNSESVGLFGKDLKSSFFLGHIYVVLFVELHTFSFLFFNLLINHFSLRYQPPLKLPFFHIWGFNVFK